MVIKFKDNPLFKRYQYNTIANTFSVVSTKGINIVPYQEVIDKLEISKSIKFNIAKPYKHRFIKECKLQYVELKKYKDEPEKKIYLLTIYCNHKKYNRIEIKLLDPVLDPEFFQGIGQLTFSSANLIFDDGKIWSCKITEGKIGNNEKITVTKKSPDGKELIYNGVYNAEIEDVIKYLYNPNSSSFLIKTKIGGEEKFNITPTPYKTIIGELKTSESIYFNVLLGRKDKSIKLYKLQYIELKTYDEEDDEKIYTLTIYCRDKKYNRIEIRLVNPESFQAIDQLTFSSARLIFDDGKIWSCKITKGEIRDNDVITIIKKSPDGKELSYTGNYHAKEEDIYGICRLHSEYFSYLGWYERGDFVSDTLGLYTDWKTRIKTLNFAGRTLKNQNCKPVLEQSLAGAKRIIYVMVERLSLSDVNSEENKINKIKQIIHDESFLDAISISEDKEKLRDDKIKQDIVKHIRKEIDNLDNALACAKSKAKRLLEYYIMYYCDKLCNNINLTLLGKSLEEIYNVDEKDLDKLIIQLRNSLFTYNGVRYSISKTTGQIQFDKIGVDIIDKLISKFSDIFSKEKIKKKVLYKINIENLKQEVLRKIGEYIREEKGKKDEAIEEKGKKDEAIEEESKKDEAIEEESKKDEAIEEEGKKDDAIEAEVQETKQLDELFRVNGFLVNFQDRGFTTVSKDRVIANICKQIKEKHSDLVEEQESCFKFNTLFSDGVTINKIEEIIKKCLNEEQSKFTKLLNFLKENFDIVEKKYIKLREGNIVGQELMSKMLSDDRIKNLFTKKEDFQSYNYEINQNELTEDVIEVIEEIHKKQKPFAKLIALFNKYSFDIDHYAGELRVKNSEQIVKDIFKDIITKYPDIIEEGDENYRIKECLIDKNMLDYIDPIIRHHYSKSEEALLATKPATHYVEEDQFDIFAKMVKENLDYEGYRFDKEEKRIYFSFIDYQETFKDTMPNPITYFIKKYFDEEPKIFTNLENLGGMKKCCNINIDVLNSQTIYKAKKYIVDEVNETCFSAEETKGSYEESHSETEERELDSDVVTKRVKSKRLLYYCLKKGFTVIDDNIKLTTEQEQELMAMMLSNTNVKIANLFTLNTDSTYKINIDKFTENLLPIIEEIITEHESITRTPKEIFFIETKELFVRKSNFTIVQEGEEIKITANDFVKNIFHKIESSYPGLFYESKGFFFATSNHLDREKFDEIDHIIKSMIIPQRTIEKERINIDYDFFIEIESCQEAINYIIDDTTEINDLEVIIKIIREIKEGKFYSRIKFAEIFKIIQKCKKILLIASAENISSFFNNLTSIKRNDPAKKTIDATGKANIADIITYSISECKHTAKTLSNTFNGLARLGFTAEQLGINQKSIAKSIGGQIKKKINSFKAIGLSNTFNGLARLGFTAKQLGINEESIANSIGDQIKEKINSFNAVELSNTFNGLAQLGFTAEQLGINEESIAKSIGDQIKEKINSFDAIHLSNTFNGLAQLGFTAEQLGINEESIANSIGDQIKKKINSFKAIGLSNTFNGLAQLGFTAEQLGINEESIANSIGDQIKKKINSFKAIGLSNTFNGLAQLGFTAEQLGINEESIAKSIGDQIKEKINSFNAVELSNTFNGLAQLGFTAEQLGINEEIIANSIGDQIKEKINSFNAVELSNTFNGLAQLGFTAEQLGINEESIAKSIGDQIKEKINSFDAIHLSNTFNGLAQLGFTYQKLNIKRLLVKIDEILKEKEEPYNMSNTLLGLIRLGMKYEELPDCFTIDKEKISRSAHNSIFRAHLENKFLLESTEDVIKPGIYDHLTASSVRTSQRQNECSFLIEKYLQELEIEYNIRSEHPLFKLNDTALIDNDIHLEITTEDKAKPIIFKIEIDGPTHYSSSTKEYGYKTKVRNKLIESIIRAEENTYFIPIKLCEISKTGKTVNLELLINKLNSCEAFPVSLDPGPSLNDPSGSSLSEESKSIGQ